MSGTLNLLGSSQTFLGLLATIIILFIIEDKSNLITFILGEIKVKLAKQIKSLNINISLDSVLNTGNYKLLNRFVNDNEEDELHNKAVELMAHISAKKTELQTNYINVEGNDPKVLEDIIKAKEILLAPLYTLLFVIVVFIFDETLRSTFLGGNGYLLSVLACFIVFSYLFWIVIWIRFLLKFKNFGNCGKGCRNILGNIRSHFWRLGRIIRIIVSMAFLLLFLVMTVVIGLFFNVSPYISVFITFILSFMILGIFMEFAQKDGEDISYAYMCGHFILIFFVSFLLVLVYRYLAVVLYIEDHLIIPGYRLMLCKTAIFVFTFLNGIVFPFTLPYITYYRYYAYAKRKTKDGQSKADEIVGELNAKLEHIAAEIPS